jgi:uncharacterized protein (TIGR03435 family)
MTAFPARSANVLATLRPALIAGLALAAPAARGQAATAPAANATAAPAAATAASASADSSAPPVYEVAAIHPSKAGGFGSHTSSHGGTFNAANVTLKSLIQSAYDLPPIRIEGGPAWLTTARFDIAAKADDALGERLSHLDSKAEALAKQQMLQALLAERFRLAVHTESRVQPVYELVVAKHGPKLTPTKAEGTSSNGGYGRLTIKGGENTMEVLAEQLSRNVGRIVVDKTGIQGRYELTLTWAPDEMRTPRPDGSVAVSSAYNSSAPSIFTALQEQLGLKLVPAKAPVPILVIDHADLPSEN